MSVLCLNSFNHFESDPIYLGHSTAHNVYVSESRVHAGPEQRAEQGPVPGQVVSEADNNLLVSEPTTFGMVNGNLETILLYSIYDVTY